MSSSTTFDFSDSSQVSKVKILDSDVELGNIFNSTPRVWDWEVEINEGNPVDRTTVQEHNLDLSVAIDKVVLMLAQEEAEDRHLEMISRRCSR